MKIRTSALCSWVLALALCAVAPAHAAELPVKPDSLKFAILGDSGTGDEAQESVARVLIQSRERFPFDMVLLLGDNLYGRERPKDYKRKFEDPYRPLIDAGVKFYASLGNHDDPGQVNYKLFNMEGRRYYSFKPRPGVRFFALDSNYIDKEQLDWLRKELQSSGSDWKICFFHHPLYSSGRRHGPAEELREVLEPLLVQHGVQVVFAGHEHLYERLEPQKGIHYFTSGAAAKLRKGGLRASEDTAKGFDQDYHFMLVEIAGDALYFETISRAGKTVDSGTIRRAK